ncbi:MAG: SLBB domain-containing protein [Sphingopyxis sp.]
MNFPRVSRIFARAAMAVTLLATMAATALPHVAMAQNAPPPAPIAAPAASTAAPAITLNEGYILGQGDVIEVAVLGRDDYRARVQVQVDGTVQLPLINDIRAANRTILQMRDDVRGALVSGGYFNNPAVSVTVASYASRYLTVLGEVATPGLVPIDRSYRLSEIIARVGGTRPTAADEITLSRTGSPSQTLSLIAMATGDESQDPIVNPGDRLYVATAPQFYIYGQVNAPGSYRVDRGMSLRMALARGGGLTAQGSERRVKVIRNGQELRNFDPNAPILSGDTVVVGERFF